MSESGTGEGAPSQRPDQKPQLSPEDEARMQRREQFVNGLNERFTYQKPDGTPFTRSEIDKTIIEAQMEATERQLHMLSTQAAGDRVTDEEFEEAFALGVRAMREDYDQNHVNAVEKLDADFKAIMAKNHLPRTNIVAMLMREGRQQVNASTPPSGETAEDPATEGNVGQQLMDSLSGHPLDESPSVKEWREKQHESRGTVTRMHNTERYGTRQNPSGPVVPGDTANFQALDVPAIAGIEKKEPDLLTIMKGANEHIQPPVTEPSTGEPPSSENTGSNT